MEVHESVLLVWEYQIFQNNNKKKKNNLYIQQHFIFNKQFNCEEFLSPQTLIAKSRLAYTVGHTHMAVKYLLQVIYLKALIFPLSLKYWSVEVKNVCSITDISVVPNAELSMAPGLVNTWKGF